MLSTTEKTQFDRQLRLPGFGEQEQLMLKNAHVLVVGIGGLGNPVVQYLAAAGVGKLTLADFDRVDIHNIHRQVLFGIHDCGLFKAEVAATKLKALYPELILNCVLEKVDIGQLPAITAGVDLIADCTDNFTARYEIGEFAKAEGIPVMFGAAHRMEGQLSLFNGKAGTHYSDAYPIPPVSERIRNCSEEGILGPIAGIVGSMMAVGIIEYLATGKTVSDGRLIRYDGANCQTYSVEIVPSGSSIPIETTINALSCEEAQAVLAHNAEIFIIDLREPYEHDDFNIGGICRPAGELNRWLNELDHVESIFLYCNRGIQSDAVSRVIATKRPGIRIAHLKGGLRKWANVSLT
jgi:molybdopterin/thiamine biosynthesis adenylyltransferase/rhodanese-related sulfurtransferase